MEVIIELSPETAVLFQQQSESDTNVNQLRTTIDLLNVSIKPQYRAEDDIAGNYFFVIETNDIDECNRIAKTLDKLPAVNAAYCKPEAEPAFLP
jgi:uncharacterized protein YtpQ (UPF0354 family)